MGRAHPVREPSERPNSQVAGRIRYFPLVQGSEDRSKGVDLADIVNQGEQIPLYIHFRFGTKGKTVHALLHTSSPWFPFRTVFQIEINFQLRGLPPLTLLFIGRQPARLPKRWLKKDTTADKPNFYTQLNFWQ